MKEFLTSQINNHTGQLLFDLLPVVTLLVTLILVLVLSGDSIIIWIKLEICIVLVAAMSIFLLDFIPLAIVQVNLIKDSCNPVLVSKEGIVENQLIISKLSIDVIDKERFVLSGELKSDIGDKIKIDYFENSKYVYTLTIEDDHKLCDRK